MDQGGMAMKKCSAFPKAPASLEPPHRIVSCHIQDNHLPSAAVHSLYSTAPADSTIINICLTLAICFFDLEPFFFSKEYMERRKLHSKCSMIYSTFSINSTNNILVMNRELNSLKWKVDMAKICMFSSILSKYKATNWTVLVYTHMETETMQIQMI